MNKSLFLVIAFFAITFGCSKGKEEIIPEVKVNRIEVEDSTIEIIVGESLSIEVNHYPSSVAAPVYEWLSSDEDIVLIENGVILAKKVGEAKITVKVKELDVSTIFNVKILPIVAESLTLSSESSEIKIGESLMIDYKIHPLNTTNLESKEIEWSTSDDKIASILDGKITGVGVGEVEIIAKIKESEIIGKITIKILPHKAESISLNLSEMILEIGQGADLVVNFTPSNATNKSVFWSSSNSKVVNVSNGSLLAIGVGEAEVKVISEDGKYEAICKVKVNPISVKFITLSKDNLNILLGDSFKLLYSIYPENSNNKLVNFSSSNESIVTVDKNGNIIAKSIGNASVKITSVSNPEVFSVCYIRVQDIDSGVNAYKASSSLVIMNGYTTGNVTSVLTSGGKEIKFISVEVKSESGQIISSNYNSQVLAPYTPLTNSIRLNSVYRPSIHYVFEIDGRRFERIVVI